MPFTSTDHRIAGDGRSHLAPVTCCDFCWVSRMILILIDLATCMHIILFYPSQYGFQSCIQIISGAKLLYYALYFR